jgi:S1-C subfamily serine protease
MKTIKTLTILSLLIITSCAGTQKRYNKNWEKVISKTISAVVLVEAPAILYDPATKDATVTNKIGSGVLISQDGWVITNAHVVQQLSGSNPDLFIKDDEPIRVTLNTGKIYIVVKSFVFVEDDIAVLKINDIHLPFVKIRELQVMPGEQCLSLGNPSPIPFVVKEGIISSIWFKEYIDLKHRLNPGKKFEEDEEPGESKEGFKSSIDGVFVHTATIHPGSSGGPLVDTDGNLIGINEFYYSSSMSYGFAIPMKTVIHLLDLVGEDVYKKLYTLN